MAENRIYLALGEEAARGTKEVSAVGFIPSLNSGIPKIEFDEKRRREFRGEDTLKGDTAVIRMGTRWNSSIEMPFFTEAGGVKGMVGTLLKHFFGKAASGQSGATGQYDHMMYPVSDPFSASNLGQGALTACLNLNEGAVMKNWPYVGGRVKALSFEQSPGDHLKVTAELMGQKRDSVTAEIGNPVFAAENLRCDYNNLTVYTGAVTRTGTGPDYTDFTFASATVIKPEKVSIKLENGMEDALRLSGSDCPDKTRMGQFKVTAELTIDWEDPASGFSSVSELNSWINSGGNTNLFFHWDTGTQAGSGANHGLYIDLPKMRRMGGEPEFSAEKDPMITLKYEGLYDADVTKYMAGLLLKNTASTI